MGILYQGQSISKGVAEGIALVTKERISYTSVDAKTGKILQAGHELYGKIAKDMILIIPSMKANVDMWKLYWCWKEGTAPKAIVAVEADDYIIAGTTLCGIPCVHRLNTDPTKSIQSGQRIRVDGDEGVVEVLD
jgi:predicted aconitase with swiveling domain